MVERGAEISVSTAARIALCSPDTVLRWIEEGAIDAWRTMPRGWWRISHASLLRFLGRCKASSSGNGGFENTANSARFSRAGRSF